MVRSGFLPSTTAPAGGGNRPAAVASTNFILTGPPAVVGLPALAGLPAQSTIVFAGNAFFCNGFDVSLFGCGEFAFDPFFLGPFFLGNPACPLCPVGLVSPLFLSLAPPIFVRPSFFPISFSITAGMFFPAGFFPVFVPTVTAFADPPMQGLAPPLVLESDTPTVAPLGQVSDEDTAGSARDAGEAAGGGAIPPAVLLVFEDGSVESVADYWLDDHWRLHFVTLAGAKHAIPLERLNLVKTSEINMQRGVNFSLDSGPSSNDK